VARPIRQLVTNLNTEKRCITVTDFVEMNKDKGQFWHRTGKTEKCEWRSWRSCNTIKADRRYWSLHTIDHLVGPLCSDTCSECKTCGHKIILKIGDMSVVPASLLQ